MAVWSNLYLKDSGLEVKSFGVNEEKINIVASNYKGLKKSIVFNSHIDTVRPILSEWKSDPYSLKIEKFLFSTNFVVGP